MVNVDESEPPAGGVTGFKLNEEEMPAAGEEALSVTAELKSLMEVIVITEVPELPTSRTIEMGDAEMLKSGIPPTVGSLVQIWAAASTTQVPALTTLPLSVIKSTR
jgi:hypothetical protein